MIEAQLPLHETRGIFPGLNLTHVKNTGVAFSLLDSRGEALGTYALIAFGFGALIVVAVYFWRTALTERCLLTALALIMGGALGNLLDRLLSGSVTDFVDVYFGNYHFYIFNVADSAISIGAVLILLGSFRQKETTLSPPSQA